MLRSLSHEVASGDFALAGGAAEGQVLGGYAQQSGILAADHFGLVEQAAQEFDEILNVQRLAVLIALLVPLFTHGSYKRLLGTKIYWGWLLAAGLAIPLTYAATRDNTPMSGTLKFPGDFWP